MNKFDLLITCPRFKERDASAEVKYFLAELGDEEAVSEPTGMPGILACQTKIDPMELIEKLKGYMEDNLVYFQYTLRYIPIQVVVNSTIDNIVDAIKELKNKIKNNDTFRITIEKRHTHIERNELIKDAATVITNKVDLENPDKIILIEIVGDKTGISIIEQEDIISIPIEKREGDFEEEDFLPY